MVLIKYSDKYVKIYFNMKITFTFALTRSKTLVIWGYLGGSRLVVKDLTP